MEYTFLEFIKKTGIFLICAEGILHFMPGTSYQKYVKVLIGIIILAQFLIPLKAVFTGQERGAIEQQITEFQYKMEMQSKESKLISFGNGVEEQVKEEIKSKLNNIALKNGYYIEDITINEITNVIVSKDKGDKIKVSRIDLDQNSMKQQEDKEELQELKRLFCAELGTEERYLEVVESG